MNHKATAGLYEEGVKRGFEDSVYVGTYSVYSRTEEETTEKVLCDP